VNDRGNDNASGEVPGSGGPSFDPGSRWTITGTLTVDSAANVLAASEDAELPATGVVALGGLRAVDSAAVAVLLSWRRRAAAESKTLTFADAPTALVALAQLYGVEDLLQAGQ
jgi:phospholipid transport system transporter-binding protein